jgi:hypothetical protein
MVLYQKEGGQSAKIGCSMRGKYRDLAPEFGSECCFTCRFDSNPGEK